MTDLRELLGSAVHRPDEVDLDAVHRRGRRRRNRSRVAIGVVGMLALVSIAGTVAVVRNGGGDGRGIAVQPPPTELATTTPPTTTAPPTAPPTASVRVVDDAKVRAFVAAVDDTFARQPWGPRCTNAAEGYSVGVPTGWYEPTPDPPDPAKWEAASMDLASYACEFFNFTPATICICTPNYGTVEISPHRDYGPYADAVTSMAKVGSDDHVVTGISGRAAECYSGPFEGERGEGYAAFCFVERDGAVLSISVSVGAPIEQELAADGRVLRSTPLSVPEDARDAARRLRDAILQSIQLIG